MLEKQDRQPASGLGGAEDNQLRGRRIRAPQPALTQLSGRPSENRFIRSHDPVMGCAARRGGLLDFPQPMERFGESECEAVGIALTAVNRLDRLLPA